MDWKAIGKVAGAIGLLGAAVAGALNASDASPQQVTPTTPRPVAVTMPEVVRVADERAKLQVDALKADQRDRDLARDDLLKGMDRKLDTIQDTQIQQGQDIAVLKATTRKVKP